MANCGSLMQKDSVEETAVTNTGEAEKINSTTVGKHPEKELNRQTSTVSSSSTSSLKSMSSRLNLIARFQRRGTAPSEDDDASVGSRWRNIRNAVKVTNAVSTKKKSPVTREDSFLKKFSTRQPYRVDSEASLGEDRRENVKSEPKEKHRSVFRLDGNLMLYWLGMVTVAVLYNLWTCIAREAFREIQREHMVMWIVLDACCDAVYLLDMACQFRTGYLDQGIMVFDSLKLAKKYVKSKYFALDLASLLPLDFLQFLIGVHPMLRFPRFIKIYRSFKFMHILESRTAFPNFFRVANLTHILFLGSHWFAAFYYLISEAEDFKGEWSYPKPVGEFASVTRKYLASLFWSTLTLTTIGDLPPPESNWEYVFVIVSYLIGVFIFATIVGQVGNVITNRNASRQEFERLLDGAKLYMRMHSVPPELQKRVQRWYDYVWKRGRMKGSDINSLGMLPDKFKTELAIHVNLETLKKVTIFQECQPEFLHDLVLKMRAYIFTPGDLICRRGEVAREMFIIADGLVEIISETGTVLTQMGTGDFFGEIGILNLDGGINRRTADVKSVGYSELFGLSREDVLEALKDHPDAEQIIREYGQRRLNEIEKHRKKIRVQPSVELLTTEKHWSPSSPCKGLKTLISPLSKRKVQKQTDIPGISITDFDEESTASSRAIHRGSSLMSSVKKLVSRTRKSQGKKRRSRHNPSNHHHHHHHHQTSLVHPSDIDQSNLIHSSCDGNTVQFHVGRGGENGVIQSHTDVSDNVSVTSDKKLTIDFDADSCCSDLSDDCPCDDKTFDPLCLMCQRSSNETCATIDIDSTALDRLIPQDQNESSNLDTHPQDKFVDSGTRASTDLCSHSNHHYDNQIHYDCSSSTCAFHHSNSRTNIDSSFLGSEGNPSTHHKDYSKVLHGVTKLPKPFALPVQFPDIEEEKTPPDTPTSSRRSSMKDTRRNCCCNQLQQHMQQIDKKLMSLETSYKESLQMLSGIVQQQNTLLSVMVLPQGSDMIERTLSNSDTEDTKL